MSLNDIHSLSHTKWNCKYHIVFAPKYRRKVFYQEKRAEVGKILRQLCEWKGVHIIEAEVCTGTTYLRNAGKGGTGGGKCGKGPILGGFAAGWPRNRGGMSQLF